MTVAFVSVYIKGHFSKSTSLLRKYFVSFGNQWEYSAFWIYYRSLV